MGQTIYRNDGRFNEIQNFGKKVARQGAGQVRTLIDKFEGLRAHRDQFNENDSLRPKKFSVGAAIGKTLLAGLGVAAIIGATVGITKFSSQILSSVGGLGAHGGIIVGVFVGIAFLASGIISAVAIAQKHRQVRTLKQQLASVSAASEGAQEAANQYKEESQVLQHQNTELKTSLSNQTAVAMTNLQNFETLAQIQKEQAAPARKTQGGPRTHAPSEYSDGRGSFDEVAMTGHY